MKKPIFVVLAGGIGKNFAPLVTNKSIFPFFGKPLIAHTLDMIQAAGIDEAIVVCNNENQTVIDNLANQKFKITTVIQNEAAGQADAISSVARFTPEDQPIIIANAVDLIDPSFLKSFIKKAAGTYAQLLGMKVDKYFLGGYLKLYQDRVVSIIEKPAKGQEPSDIVTLSFTISLNHKRFLR